MTVTILLILFSAIIFGLIFASMNRSVDKISAEVDDSAEKSLTLFGYLKNILNLVQLISIIIFYCAVLYMLYFFINLIW